MERDRQVERQTQRPTREIGEKEEVDWGSGEKQEERGEEEHGEGQPGPWASPPLGLASPTAHPWGEDRDCVHCCQPGAGGAHEGSSESQSS